MDSAICLNTDKLSCMVIHIDTIAHFFHVKGKQIIGFLTFFHLVVEVIALRILFFKW